MLYQVATTPVIELGDVEFRRAARQRESEMTTRRLAALRGITQGPAHRWWALAAVECGNFVVYMDGFIVTLALPAIARDLGIGLRSRW
jgi:hypothetical protein